MPILAQQLPGKRVYRNSATYRTTHNVYFPGICFTGIESIYIEGNKATFNYVAVAPAQDKSATQHLTDIAVRTHLAEIFEKSGITVTERSPKPQGEPGEGYKGWHNQFASIDLADLIKALEIIKRERGEEFAERVMKVEAPTSIVERWEMTL